MKYVVSGYIGFDNFGDEAIAHVLVEKIKKKGAEKITLISSNPEKTKKIHDVDSCKMLCFFKPLLEADVLVSGGGSLLQDITSIKSLIYYLLVIFTALFFGKKVIIFAQGIGPIKSKFGKILTKFALKHCYEISVRDVNSQQLLQSWGINAELVNDPILDLELSHKNSTGTVGIQLRSFEGVNDEFMHKLANEICIRFKNKKIILLSLHDNLDENVCNEFALILKEKGINSEVLSNLNINQVFEIISNLEYLVAMRFHANVVGIKSGVRTLAINYDPKVKSLADKYNLPIIDLNTSDFSTEFDKLIN